MRSATVHAVTARFVFGIAAIATAVLSMTSSAGLSGTNSGARIRGDATARVVRSRDGLSVALYAATPLPTPTAGDDANRARLFLKQYAPDFFGVDTTIDVAATRTTTRQTGHGTTVRLQQRERGLVVHGAEAIVHLDRDGVRRVRSSLVPGLQRIDVTPEIARATAEIRARTLTRQPVRGGAELELIDLARLRGLGTSTWTLAWRVAVGAPGRGEIVWIDARSGAALHRQPEITHAFLTYITDNNDACPSNPPVAGYDETSDFAAAPAPVADVFTFLSASYRYFLDALGRDGLHDAAGTPRTIQAIVGECADAFAVGSAPRESASWDRAAFTMRFGAGMARADDVVGHEYGHAVIDDTARFEMTGQSGALAEAFADVFGEVIDQRQAVANDDGDARWEFGEDAPGGPFRDLSSPARFQQPDKISDTARYYCGYDADIAAHTNSGVLTHAFALLVDGGTFNGVSVQGINIDKAARIFHRTLSDHLTSTATFSEAYEELLNAADDLVAEGAIDQTDKVALVNALNAVELHTLPCTTQLPYCPAGFAPVMAFYDGFENVTSGRWLNSAAAGVNHWNLGAGTPDIYHSAALDPKPDDFNNPRLIPVAHRGQYGLWADTARDSKTATLRIGDSSVETAAAIDLPPGIQTFLQFENQFTFQMYEMPGQPVSGPEPDGAVIEYSVDGATWIDAGPMIVAGQSYSGAIQAGYDNPLAGRNAFVGSTPGYVSTRLDLSPIAGQRARFRFRAATDRTDGDVGWFIDDVATYSCTPSQLVVQPTAGLITSEDGGAATFTVALAAMPASAMVVRLASSNTAEGVVEPALLIFEPSNWSVPQPVTVRGVDDGGADGAVPYSVTVSIDQGGNSVYALSASVPVQLSNTDNEQSASATGGGGGGAFLAALLGAVYLIRRVWRRWVKRGGRNADSN